MLTIPYLVHNSSCLMPELWLLSIWFKACSQRIKVLRFFIDNFCKRKIFLSISQEWTTKNREVKRNIDKGVTCNAYIEHNWWTTNQKLRWTCLVKKSTNGKRGTLRWIKMAKKDSSFPCTTYHRNLKKKLIIKILKLWNKQMAMQGL